MQHQFIDCQRIKMFHSGNAPLLRSDKREALLLERDKRCKGLKAKITDLFQILVKVLKITEKSKDTLMKYKLHAKI